MWAERAPSWTDLLWPAYFNLFAAAGALHKPQLMFSCYPPAIIKAAKVGLGLLLQNI